MATSRPPLRVLVDTNVVLDLLLRREPWFTEAQPYWQARDAGRLVAYLPASVLTDIFYIGRRQVGADQALASVLRCVREFGLISVHRAIIQAALALSGSDFEDNVQIACAQAARMDLIVTRDVAGFRDASIRAILPQEITSYLAP